MVFNQKEFEDLLRRIVTEVVTPLFDKKREKMYTTDEAAEYLRISKKTLKRWTVDGRVRCSKPGYKALYSEDDLQALVLNKRSG